MAWQVSKQAVAILGHDDHILNLQSAKSNLGVGSLDAKYHPWCQWGIVRGGKQRRVVASASDSDAMPNMRSLEMADASTTHPIHSGFEDMRGGHAGTYQLERSLQALD
jgi:hypothetical protein